MYAERFYRENADGARFRSVRLAVAESDLWIAYGSDLSVSDGVIRARAERALRKVRGEIEAWAASHPLFLESFDPLPVDSAAPPVILAMLRAGAAVAVGPMAAVAGAVAEAVGRDLVAAFGLSECVVENGGDLWISIREPLLVGIYAGLSSLSGTVGIVVAPDLSPCGLATSSGTVGPSFSYGKADAALVIASDAAAADAWATALGNRSRSFAEAEVAVRDLALGPAAARSFPDDGLDALRPRGALVVMADRLAAAGSIRLAPLQKSRDSL